MKTTACTVLVVFLNTAGLQQVFMETPLTVYGVFMIAIELAAIPTSTH